MPAERAILHLSVHTGGRESGEVLHHLTDGLRRDLLALGVMGEARQHDQPAHTDRHAHHPSDGVLRFTLDRSPAALVQVVDVVCTWLRRQPPLAISLRMGDANLTLGGGGSHTERDRIIETWIDRALAP
jgi:hypothetical protein